jgi:hypothetical protein
LTAWSEWLTSNGLAVCSVPLTSLDLLYVTQMKTMIGVVETAQEETRLARKEAAEAKAEVGRLQSEGGGQGADDDDRAVVD